MVAAIGEFGNEHVIRQELLFQKQKSLAIKHRRGWHCLGSRHPVWEHQFKTWLLGFRSSVLPIHLERQQTMACRSLGPRHPHWKPGCHSRFQDSVVIWTVQLTYTPSLLPPPSLALCITNK